MSLGLRSISLSITLVAIFGARQLYAQTADEAQRCNGAYTFEFTHRKTWYPDLKAEILIPGFVRDRTKRVGEMTDRDFADIQRFVDRCASSGASRIDPAQTREAITRVKRDIRNLVLRPVIAELETMHGHRLSDEENSRLAQIKVGFPELQAAAKEIEDQQDELKDQARLAEQRQHENIEKQKVLEADRRRRNLEDQLAKQDAEDEAASKKDAFEKSLPPSCKDAVRSNVEMKSKDMQEKLAKVTSFAAAGDTTRACEFFASLYDKTEKTRTLFVQCAKELDGNSDEIAKGYTEQALSEAINIHAGQAGFKRGLREMQCPE